MRLGSVSQWNRKETIYQAGEPARDYYKVIKGMVAEVRLLDDGRRQITSIRMKGDLCGYPTLNGHHLFTGHAITNVEACSISSATFDSLIRKNVAFACAVIDDTSNRLRQASREMIALGQYRATERVAHFIVDMLDRCRERGIRTEPLTLSLSREEIGNYLGLEFETVSRAIGKLRNRGLISTEGFDAIWVRDETQLRAITDRL